MHSVYTLFKHEYILLRLCDFGDAGAAARFIFLLFSLSHTTAQELQVKLFVIAIDPTESCPLGL